MYVNMINLLQFRDSVLSGTHSGILCDIPIVLEPSNNSSGVYVMTQTAPEHTRMVLGESHSMSYHIAGYGLRYNEAKIRMQGESVERYATVISKVLHKDKIIETTINNLKETEKNSKTLDSEYINTLEINQLNEMHAKNRRYAKEIFSDDTKVEFTKAYSLFDPNVSVFLPASMFYVGDDSKKIFTPAFTTGTACHETTESAFLSGLIEAIQIDAFVYSWYTSVPRNVLDLNSLPQKLQQTISKVMGTVADTHNLIIHDYSEHANVKIPIFGFFLIAKDGSFPAIAFGVQAGLNIDTVLYRGIQEALSVLVMNYELFLSDRYEHMKERLEKDEKFLDLDSNVLFYGLPQNFEKNKKYIDKYVRGYISYEQIKSTYVDFEEKEAIKILVNEIQKTSECACFLDITPPYYRELNLNVMRTFIPEYLTMCFPSFPQKNHPRYKDEFCMEHPHPLP